MQDNIKAALLATRGNEAGIGAVKNAIARRNGIETGLKGNTSQYKKPISPQSDFEKKLIEITENMSYSRKLTSLNDQENLSEARAYLTNAMLDYVEEESSTNDETAELEEQIIIEHSDELLGIFASLNKLENSDVLKTKANFDGKQAGAMAFLGERLAKIIDQVENSHPLNSSKANQIGDYSPESFAKNVQTESIKPELDLSQFRSEKSSYDDEDIFRVLKQNILIESKSPSTSTGDDISPFLTKLSEQVAGDATKLTFQNKSATADEPLPADDLSDLKSLLADLKIANKSGNESNTQDFLASNAPTSESTNNDGKQGLSPEFLGEMHKQGKELKAQKPFTEASKSIPNFNVRLEEFPSMMSRLVQNAKSEITSQAKLTMNPKSLGTVFVEINLTGTAVSIDIQTANKETAKKLETQIGVLKEKLGNLGIQIDEINVRDAETKFAQDQNTGQRGNRSKKEKNESLKKYLDLLQDEASERSKSFDIENQL